MSDMISQVAKHLCRTHQEMDFAKARNRETRHAL